MQRPGGVTLLAILNFISAAVLVCMGLALFLGLGIFGSMTHERGSGLVLAGLGALGGIFFLVLAAVSAVVGYGMWNLQNWARIISIVFACLAILGGVLGMMTGMLHFQPFWMVTNLFRMAIAALIIWYLFQPHVKAAFGTA